MTDLVPPVPGQLTTAASVVRRFPAITKNVDPEVIEEEVTAATSHLEDRASRRLAPFVNTLYETDLWGLNPNEYGASQGNVPLPFAGSLGMSYANALGADDLVRAFWLTEYAPVMPELWTYDITSAEIFLTYGNQQPLDLSTGALIGDSPSATDGFCWLRLGTFAPEGTRIKIVYSGGYTVQIPPSLSKACQLQTAKFLMINAEPNPHANTSFDEIDSQIDMLIAPLGESIVVFLSIEPLPGNDEFADQLDAFLKRTLDWEPALDLIMANMAVMEDQRFAAEGPGWAALSPNTIKTQGDSILVRTGALRKSLTVGGAGSIRITTATSVYMGTNVADDRGRRYAGFHQSGTDRMPARPIVDILPDTIYIWTKILQSYWTEGAAMSEATSASGLTVLGG